ncbi:MAG: Tricarboxylic transport membrane protein [Oscillospiraceae bacterium]|jgi:putative tricarboxylic transport membrane protein
MRSLKKRLLASTFAGLLAISVTACSSTAGTASNATASESAATNSGNSESQTVEYPKKAMQFIAPAGAGGGWDLTIRTVAKCLQDTQLVDVPMPVTNMSGGGGGIALSYLEQHKDADNIIAVYSPPLCLINLNGSTELNYKDNTTPIARLITDYGCFSVAKDSKYNTITEVMDALKEDPKSVKIGGTSGAGSMDHIQFLKVAKAAGVKDIDKIDYVSFQDGQATAELMGKHIDLLTSGISDTIGLVESGSVKVLAITAEDRVGSGLIAEMPTCKEQGIDVTFYNWRGLFGPKNMPDYARQYWETTLEKMCQTQEWKDACDKYGWDLSYANSDDFEEFLDEENQEYMELLQDIGMLKNQ